MKEAQRILHWKASQQKGNCTGQNPDGESRHRQLASWRSWTETLLTLVTEKKLHWSEHWWENRHRQYASWTENCQRKETAQIKLFLIEVIMQKRKSMSKSGNTGGSENTHRKHHSEVYWNSWWQKTAPVVSKTHRMCHIHQILSMKETPALMKTVTNHGNKTIHRMCHVLSTQTKEMSTDHQAGRAARASLDSIHNVQTNLFAQNKYWSSSVRGGACTEISYLLHSKLKTNKKTIQSQIVQEISTDILMRTTGTL